MSIWLRMHGRRRFWPFLLAAVTAACGVGAVSCGHGNANETTPSTATTTAPPPQSKTDDERPKIVVLGDSLTAGLGLLETQSYPHLLQEKVDHDGYNYEVINAGVSGDTSAGGLRRLDW